MHVFLADICDTAYVKDLDEDEITALCDHINEAVKTCKDAILILRWKKKTYPNRQATLLYKTRVWVTPMGIRKVRIQCHRISEDGRVGTRQILEERRQGRIVRW